ncbi:MAG: hypothetical protein ACWA47_03545 [Brevirhabdus sp.]
MTDKSQFRFAGLASFIAAATYLVGFALLLSVLAPSGYGSHAPDPLRATAFMQENPNLMRVWNLIIYIINATALVFLAIGWRKMAPQSALAGIAAAFGLIWAGLLFATGMFANVMLEEVLRRMATEPESAAALWRDMLLVEQGLGGGNEIVGGLWVLIGSLAARAVAGWPAALRWLGVVIGLSGLATVLPGLSDPLGAVFGLGFIVWFLWAGFVMLRA